MLLFLQVFIYYLFEKQSYWVKEKETESKRERSSIWGVHSPNGCNDQGWDRPKPEAKNSILVSHMVIGIQAHRPSSVFGLKLDQTYWVINTQTRPKTQDTGVLNGNLTHYAQHSLHYIQTTSITSNIWTPATLSTAVGADVLFDMLCFTQSFNMITRFILLVQQALLPALLKGIWDQSWYRNSNQVSISTRGILFPGSFPHEKG